ncbi:MAG: hypothetical protein ACSLFB_06515 [Acidimicrobiales bacterium]
MSCSLGRAADLARRGTAATLLVLAVGCSACSTSSSDQADSSATKAGITIRPVMDLDQGPCPKSSPRVSDARGGFANRGLPGSQTQLCIRVGTVAVDRSGFERAAANDMHRLERDGNQVGWSVDIWFNPPGEAALSRLVSACRQANATCPATLSGRGAFVFMLGRELLSGPIPADDDLPTRGQPWGISARSAAMSKRLVDNVDNALNEPSVRRPSMPLTQVAVGWFFLLVGVLTPILFVVAVARRRSRFDALVSPADDLLRADDGYRRTLAERDGTGGLI